MLFIQCDKGVLFLQQWMILGNDESVYLFILNCNYLLHCSSLFLKGLVLIFYKFMLTLMRFNFNLVSLVCFNLLNRELLLDSLKLKFILTNSNFKTIHFTTFLVTFIVEHINY